MQPGVFADYVLLSRYPIQILAAFTNSQDSDTELIPLPCPAPLFPEPLRRRETLNPEP